MKADAKIHKWEDAGIGQAPFRYVGNFDIPSPSLAEQNPDAYNNAMRSMPKGYGIGACGYCGASLVHNFLIHSSDGRKFAVGCECVNYCGDAGLIKLISAADKARKQAMRDEKRRLENVKREAAYRSAREEQAQAERKRNNGLTDAEVRKAAQDRKVEILKPIADRMRTMASGFCESVVSGLDRGELPYGRGLCIMLDILAKQAGRYNSKAYWSEYEAIEELISKI